MRPRRPGSPWILALALASGSLPAQEVQYGGQFTASLPGSTLGGSHWLRHQTGAGAGVHGFIAMKDGFALVPRIDYARYEKNPLTVQVVQLGVDFDSFFSDRAGDGPYIGGGLNFAQARLELSGGGAAARATPKAPGASALGGWMFTRHLGAEWRWSWSKFKPRFTGTVPPGYPTDAVVGAQFMNASFIFHF